MNAKYVEELGVSLLLVNVCIRVYYEFYSQGHLVTKISSVLLNQQVYSVPPLKSNGMRS